MLTEEEAAQCIAIEFNPIRAGFDGSEDIWVRDVLNLGFRPVTAIDLVSCPCIPAYAGQSACTCVYSDACAAADVNMLSNSSSIDSFTQRL